MTTATPIAANYSAVLSRLVNVTPDGDGRWTARCPAHEDHRNSLRLWIGNNGALLIGCWAGCEKLAVLKAADLTFRDLFPGGGQRRGEIPHVSRRVVATYDYRDQDGALLYQTVRYEPKDFRQRRPDGRGGWIGNLDGVRRVLYRLPDVLATDGPVWIVEGEKDADALWRIGCVATTRAMGAKSAWLPEYTWALTGRAVYVVPDNDQAGRDGAAIVAGHLVATGHVASVGVVHLPGLPDHGDVSDWIAAQRGLASVLALKQLIGRVYRTYSPGISNAG
jgi:putative DNA primase/helicase